jgi:hypothetical protein
MIDHSRWLVCLSGGIMEPNRTILAPHCERVADDSCDLKLCLTSVRHPATCHQSPGGVKTLLSILHFASLSMLFILTNLEQALCSLPSYCIPRILEDWTAASGAAGTVELSAIGTFSWQLSIIQHLEPVRVGLEVLFSTVHLPQYEFKRFPHLAFCCTLHD